MISVSELAPMDIAPRAGRLRARFDGFEAMAVTDHRNIRYLCGFSGSAGVLLVLADEMVLVTDGRYEQQATEETDGAVRVVIGRTPAEQARLAAECSRGLARLGVEADDVTLTRRSLLSEQWFPGVELVATTALVEADRAIKDLGEVARIERAAQIADEALSLRWDEFVEGQAESDFAAELDHAMRRGGAQGPSFDTIVAAGPNSAVPHHRPGPRPIVEGDLVVCDFGALVDGYASDMTRTFVVGEPTSRQRELLAVVTAAQQAGVDSVRAGIEARHVDVACRQVIADAGLGDRFVHGTGHGVGLAIHEIPFLGSTSQAVLETANVVTVEPGVYIAGLGGVRVEDSLVVLPHGCRPLTLHPKDPTCLRSPRTSSRTA